MERARARSFVDMLGNVQVSRGPLTKQIAQIREVDALIREARIRAALPRRSGSGSTGSTTALEARRAALVARLRRQDTELADSVSIAHRSLGDVRRRLGREDLMLYTLPTSDGGELIRFLAISAGGTRVIETGISHDELEGLLTLFTSDDPLGQAGAQEEAAREIAKRLALADWIPDGTLHVVPSRALYFVPWGALPLEVPVVILPNGGWATRAPRRVALSNAVVVGDPALGTSWQSLPGAGEEAAMIARSYGTQPLTGTDASVASLRSRVGQGVGVLHLATHGVFDTRDPLASAILLSDAGETDRLTAEDLFEAPLPADLVVLSACETGVGQVTAGEDFLGLARSFYLSGARAVVNSLWPVYDKPTRRFMEVFHTHAGGGDIGGAWLRARNTLRDEGFPPAIYGAFVLGGATRI